MNNTKADKNIKNINGDRGIINLFEKINTIRIKIINISENEIFRPNIILDWFNKVPNNAISKEKTIFLELISLLYLTGIIAPLIDHIFFWVDQL